jgi:hypothetical protein
MMIIMMAFVFRETAAGREGDPRAFAQQMLWVQIPSNIVGTVLQGLIYVYVAFGIALIYFDVLHRKEGTDLLAASERLVLGTSGEA